MLGTILSIMGIYIENSIKGEHFCIIGKALHIDPRVLVWTPLGKARPKIFPVSHSRNPHYIMRERALKTHTL